MGSLFTISQIIGYFKRSLITTHGENEQLKAMGEEFNIAGLGCSDFHNLDQIGLVATRVFDSISNYQDVLKAIKERKVEAFVRRDIPLELIGLSCANPGLSI